MKKLVPDPPIVHLGETAFGTCEGHPPLFTVRASISAEDVLVHAALYLRRQWESKTLEKIGQGRSGLDP